MDKIVINCDKFSKKEINFSSLDFVKYVQNGETNLEIDLFLENNSELIFKLELEDYPQEINIIIKAVLCEGTKLISLFFLSSLNIKIDFVCDLIGFDSECDVRALIFGECNSLNIINTFQNHLSYNTKSSILTRRILNKDSEGKYYGKILIKEDAINSDASQEDAIFILGNNIRNSSVPALEIKNNDVKCKHAFFAYKPDDLSIIYLKTRGFEDGQVTRLFIDSFINSIFNDQKFSNLFNMQNILNKINNLKVNFLEGQN